MGLNWPGKEKMRAALVALKRTFDVEDPVMAKVQSGVAAMKISSKASGMRALMSTHPPWMSGSSG